MQLLENRTPWLGQLSESLAGWFELDGDIDDFIFSQEDNAPISQR